MAAKKDHNIILAEEISKFYDDPLGFVLFSFPWGEEGQLANFNGPRLWQWEFLEEWGKNIKQRRFDGVHAVDPLQFAISSGHGIGKSALSSWIILFIASTRPHCKGIVTSNTSDQLKTKTWSELGKWLSMCVTKDWFIYNSSKGNMNLLHKDHQHTWRVDAQTCREENSESFAGLHAATSTPFYLFDEASAIPNKIWEVSDGGLTDGEPMRFAFGNPTRNSGRFFECFGRLKHRWITRTIDSRDVAGTNKELLNTWVEDFGEDSDFVRVRVRGVFPRAGSAQFIPSDLVRSAQQNSLTEDIWGFAPKTLGIDVARFGDDQSVITRRQGRKMWPQKKFRSIDLMTFSGLCAQEIDEFKPDAVFVDGVGLGAGVVDRLRQLGYRVIDVQAGGKPLNKKYKNKRAEMWGNMKEWLAISPDIPIDPELESAMTSVEYGFTPSGQVILESKDDMKKRGEASPDEADSVALTFAEPISQGAAQRFETGETEYDPLRF